MYDQLLIPTDGSTVAEAAVDAAVSLADAFDATLHVVHVLNPDGLRLVGDSAPSEDAKSHGRRVTESAAKTARNADIEATTAVLEGTEPVHRTILDYAEQEDVDCIVMGTHGRTGLGRLVMGSITELLLRESPVPVFTVHEDTVVDPAFETVLVPTDGSDCAEMAGEEAVELAQWSGAALHTIYVIDIGIVGANANIGIILESIQETGEDATREIVDRAVEAGIHEVKSAVLRGIPYWSILEYAEQKDVDCIVMGTHGRTGFERYFLGSVTERVARLADVPVLTVKGPAAPEPAEQLEEL